MLFRRWSNRQCRWCDSWCIVVGRLSLGWWKCFGCGCSCSWGWWCRRGVRSGVRCRSWCTFVRNILFTLQPFSQFITASSHSSCLRTHSGNCHCLRRWTFSPWGCRIYWSLSIPLLYCIAFSLLLFQPLYI